MLYTYERVQIGQYSRLHGTIPNITLIHGIVGIIGFIYFLSRYVKKSKDFPFIIVSIIWLVIYFYFNMQIAICGVIGLITVNDMKVNHRKEEPQIERKAY